MSEPKQFRVSLDELFDGSELWDALNKGSNDGHYIEIDGAVSKDDAVSLMINQVIPQLKALLEKYIEEAPSDEEQENERKNNTTNR